MRPLIIAMLTILLTACGEPPVPAPSDELAAVQDPASANDAVGNDTAASVNTLMSASTRADDLDPSSLAGILAGILATQPAATQARYVYRHPLETLEFFGIAPGMTVVEALPGGGWYSKLLLPYLNQTGRLIGADYPTAIWPNFAFANEEYMAKKATWIADWTLEAQGWRQADDASVGAFLFGEMPADLQGSADAVLLIRALHNLARYSDPTDQDKNYLQQTLRDVFSILKPGGIVGVVQHQANEEAPDAWANGGTGYLKKSFVIEQMTQAGFEFVDSSDINNNPKDQPTTDDIVWRLPPTLATSGDNAERKAAMLAIGESNRMTLKFTKPGADGNDVGG